MNGATPSYGSTARAHCKPCGRVTSWLWVGFENHAAPRVDHWRCLVDGHRRMQMADVTDAENLARTILERQVRSRGDMSRADYEDALQLVLAELVDLYGAWDPTRGVRFTAYATGLLRLRVNNWWRQQLGRDVPKAMTGALSLDAEAPDGSELAEAVAAGASDPQVGGHPDLHWALARGGRAVVQPTPPTDHGRGRSRATAAAGRNGGVDRKPDARASA